MANVEDKGGLLSQRLDQLSFTFAGSPYLVSGPEQFEQSLSCRSQFNSKFARVNGSHLSTDPDLWRRGIIQPDQRGPGRRRPVRTN